MRVILRVQAGSSAGQQIVVQTGESVTIGRAAPSDFVFPDDTHMSGKHFRIECGEHTCTLRDLKSSNGTLLNGHGAAIALLRNGDAILAGKTNFVVQTEQERADRSTATLASATENASPQDRLLSLFRNEFQPLYALLDAAVEPSILKVILESKEEYASLYQGSSSGQLTHFAPYLVGLPRESQLLETLVRQGWGKSWGVYLTSDQTLEELRKHFRHFLMVKMPDGKQVYFRFYDPRVLRVYLPTCSDQETAQFFGPIHSYVVEDEKPEKLLRFFNRGRGGGKTVVALAEQAKIGEQRPVEANPEMKSLLEHLAGE